MIIIKPIVTEKMTAISEELNQFGFVVDNKANKYQIKAAVEELYDVNVLEVRTMNYLGKKSSRYTKTGGFVSGRKKSFKKAIITVAEGETIDFYSNI